MDKIEGEKEGVTASVDKSEFVSVNAAKDAKVGQVELTIKNKAGKTASLKVTVQEPVNKLVGSNSVTNYIEVEQGEKDVDARFAISVKNLKDLNDGKAEVSVSAGKDGLSAKVVTGEEYIGIKVSATKDAKLGVQELTVKSGNSTNKLNVTVKAAAAK